MSLTELRRLPGAALPFPWRRPGSHLPWSAVPVPGKRRLTSWRLCFSPPRPFRP